jgi:large subunit ribosomal protein L6
MWGTDRALLANLVTGVTKGFEQRLEITGVGYRAQLQGKILTVALGYSHDIVYAIPDGITIAVTKPTEIVISGIDRQKVGQVSAEIRAYRPQGHQIRRRIRLPQGRQEEVMGVADGDCC